MLVHNPRGLIYKQSFSIDKLNFDKAMQLYREKYEKYWADMKQNQVLSGADVKKLEKQDPAAHKRCV